MDQIRAFDMFCGAGGASLGAREGARLSLVAWIFGGQLLIHSGSISQRLRSIRGSAEA